FSPICQNPTPLSNLSGFANYNTPFLSGFENYTAICHFHLAFSRRPGILPPSGFDVCELRW
ncbi:MAG: hypothetical protein MUF81_13860, partial [Verrucomicrobia bacterium]|nr:hypothetical protein [Verrucomicrobiota bacterium]